MSSGKKSEGSDVYEVDVLCTVRVVLTDKGIVRRAVQNEDDWRGQFYDLRDEDAVLEHFAFNAVKNGVYRVNQLDGWADFSGTSGLFGVGEVSIESVRKVGK